MRDMMEIDAVMTEFTPDELSIFKRYLEEDIVVAEGALDYVEENLSYYAGRHTSDAYFSPAESLQANAFIAPSEELVRNLGLYDRALQWHSATVHPADSEYVIKREKYVYVTDVPPLLSDLVEYLNAFPMRDFFIADVLVQLGGQTYQYLPQKDFLFRRTGLKLAASHIRDLTDAEGWADFEAELQGELPCAILPVFTPIRRMLFMGEAGYRLALQEYGQLEERMRSFLAERVKGLRHVRVFETVRLNAALGLDGIERSVLGVLLWSATTEGSV